MQSDRQLLELVLQKLEELENSHLNLERKVDEIYKNTKQICFCKFFAAGDYAKKNKIQYKFFMIKISHTQIGIHAIGNIMRALNWNPLVFLIRHYLTLSMYSPVSVFTLIRSPSLMKAGA